MNAAVVRASGLTLTVSTGGASPGLARRLREDLSTIFGDARFGRFLGALRSMREALPRGERAARMAEAVKGFTIEAKLRYPGWFFEPPTTRATRPILADQRDRTEPWYRPPR